MDNTKSKIKHILVATDFSETSNFAILRAVELAKNAKASLSIVHVVQKKPVDKWLDNSLKNLLPKNLWVTTEEHKSTLLQKQITQLINLKYKVDFKLLSAGNSAKKLLQYAKKNNIDLLVIGAHGKYSIRDSFVGTTAEYVIKKTRCPVLIVKKQPKKPYQRILVPVDFSNLTRIAFNYAIQLFQHTNIRLIHVGDHEYEELLRKGEKEEQVTRKKIIQMRKAILFYLDNKIKKFIKSNSKKNTIYPYDIILGHPATTIIKKATTSKSDLIVMGTQGHGKMHYLYIGSVANRVVTEVDKDVLLVPPMR